MTTYREESSVDTREDDLGTTRGDPAAPTWADRQDAIRGRQDAEPLMGAVLDLVHDLDEQVTNLKVALQSNRRIGIAIGIVMSQRRITDEAAFLALRGASQNSNRKLRDVAEDVIYAGRID